MPLLIFLRHRLADHLLRLFRQHGSQLVPILPGRLLRNSGLGWIRLWLKPPGFPQPFPGLCPRLTQFLRLGFLKLAQCLIRCKSTQIHITANLTVSIFSLCLVDVPE